MFLSCDTNNTPILYDDCGIIDSDDQLHKYNHLIVFIPNESIHLFALPKNIDVLNDLSPNGQDIDDLYNMNTYHNDNGFINSIDVVHIVVRKDNDNAFCDVSIKTSISFGNPLFSLINGGMVTFWSTYNCNYDDNYDDIYCFIMSGQLLHKLWIFVINDPHNNVLIHTIKFVYVDNDNDMDNNIITQERVARRAGKN